VGVGVGWSAFGCGELSSERVLPRRRAATGHGINDELTRSSCWPRSSCVVPNHTTIDAKRTARSRSTLGALGSSAIIPFVRRVQERSWPLAQPPGGPRHSCTGPDGDEEGGPDIAMRCRRRSAPQREVGQRGSASSMVPKLRGRSAIQIIGAPMTAVFRLQR